MSARPIVTSHPDVACDVCGRRLLRGETAEAFLAGSEVRTVCELCVVRASHEGWKRESDGPSLSRRSTRPRRARTLLGRLRGLREPATSPDDGAENERLNAPQRPERGFLDAVGAEKEQATAEDWSDHQPTDAEGLIEEGEQSAHAPYDPERADLQCAIEHFNLSPQPRRIAGIARSLGQPQVSVRRSDDAVSRIVFVVAWELCWYRYEVSLSEETTDVPVIAQGMELTELSEAERAYNASIDERGEVLLF